MTVTSAPPELLDSVRSLRAEVEQAVLALDTQGVDSARALRRSMLSQLDGYLLPRLRDLKSPLLAVVGGSTGAGKSTLVNSLTGAVVSRSGVLRPTTRASVLVHHPADAQWFEAPRVLPDLHRVTDRGGLATHAPQDPRTVRLVAHTGIPAGLAVLDAPDIDSVVADNRTLARELLAAADLWLFVTTPARYADAVPWEVLREAAARGTSVAMVLDRVHPGQEEVVRDHLAHLLVTEGLKDTPLFVVPESPLNDDALLPPASVQPLQRWISSLGKDAAARTKVINQTLEGTLSSLAPRLGSLIEASKQQVDTIDALDDAAWNTAQNLLQDFSARCVDGSLISGELMGAWHEFVSEGSALHRLATGRKLRPGRAMDRHRENVAVLEGEVRAALATALTAQIVSLGKTCARTWRSLPGGAALVAAHPEVVEPTPDLPDRAQQVGERWVAQLEGLIAGHHTGTARAKAAPLDTPTWSVVLALVVMGAQIPESTHPTPSSDAAELARRVFVAGFGQEDTLTLLTDGHAAAMALVSEVFESEVERLRAVLGRVPVDRAQAARLSHAMAALKDVR